MILLEGKDNYLNGNIQVVYKKDKRTNHNVVDVDTFNCKDFNSLLESLKRQTNFKSKEGFVVDHYSFGVTSQDHPRAMTTKLVFEDTTKDLDVALSFIQKYKGLSYNVEY